MYNLSMDWMFGQNAFWNLGWFLPLVLLEIVLKGFALWRSAKNNQPIWFVVILVINSMGILPLIYLIMVDKNYVFKDLQKRFS